MADAAAIDATITDYLAAFTANDREAYIGCFAGDESWIEDPVGSPRRQGTDELRKFFDDAHAMADTIELRPGTIRTIIGDEAVFTFEARPAIRGTTYVVDVIDHMTFDDAGKITTMRAFFDASKMRPADA